MAIQAAARAATGDYMIMCDADLEYAPEEIPSLLLPVLAGDAQVVDRTRTFGSHTAYSFWYVTAGASATSRATCRGRGLDPASAGPAPALRPPSHTPWTSAVWSSTLRADRQRRGGAPVIASICQ